MSLPCPGSNGVREMVRRADYLELPWWHRVLLNVFVAIVILPLALTLPLWGWVVLK